MYDKSIEKKYYEICEQRGYFEVDGNKKIQEENKFFCIMMPPPNVTGVLHIGHALTFSLQDIYTRYKRMDGFKCLYQPGLDHAGIATQNVVEKELLKEGIKKEELGREEFIKRVWKWKEQSGGKILNQMRTLGISPAWSRLRFTMDEGLANAVKKAFVSLYNEGLIYRGDRMINWCTKDGALSDIEVEHQENKGKLYHLRYFLKKSGFKGGELGNLKEGKDYIVVATTRPETFFGDSAVMINPKDERYKDLLGEKLLLPLVNKELEIIADEAVDMEFGTGLVKVTPAHDMNDYEVGLRHRLDFVKIFDEKGILNEHCLNFQGLERLEARDLIVKELEKMGFVEKIEDYNNQIGLCYRCKNVVEPYISKQFFVKSEIAKESIERVNLGQMSFFPPHWINSFNAWMRDLKDWCISRQLWWGHQIPVYYCECGNEIASQNPPLKCEKCGSSNLRQEEDVLDTWFSSGLWAMSTLGWGNEKFGEGKLWQKDDLKHFYPNSLLITGFDILFFWVARMLFQSTKALNELPFKEVYLHALVKDELGQKMSKSLGNVIDPNESIEEFSADILRFSLALLAVQGRDIKLSRDKLIQVRNFTNKLYNACEFLLLNEPKFEDLDQIELKSELGKYLFSRFNLCVFNVREHLKNYRFNDASNTIYRFFWDEFCDLGIELCKAEKACIKELGSIFKEALRLLNPFMPFISEYLYHKLSSTSLENSDSLMISKYPKFSQRDEKAEKRFSLIIESIVSIRRAKALLDLGTSKIAKAFVKFNERGDEELIKEYKHFIKALAKCEELEFTQINIDKASSDVSENLKVFIPLEGVDLSAIIKRLEARKIKLGKEKDKLENMLKNENFIKNAPKEVLAQNEQNLANLKIQLEKIEEELQRLR
ncbi:valine--tRNA ligase [Campylobacter sp. MIT 99-7217]|uniref:valine--tRNA ligase n=1 Tax=Campylobacter sp. MIT 99-7217 TaxID=535091 RepID=UPI00115A7112|nr:valine--tRNA ligase [Campylobacter sp. MIT 99-7217]TQR32989.1 valine--tRNA ligase [Campylobacter sp. MIT 99-7217]